MPTQRYIANAEPMDASKVAWPAHISQCDSGLGYGDRCWVIRCGGTEIQSGIDAIRKVYPDIQVTANRITANKMLHES